MQCSKTCFTIVFAALILLSQNAARADKISFSWYSTITPGNVPMAQTAGGSLGLAGQHGAATYFGRAGVNYNDEHGVGATYLTVPDYNATYNNQPFAMTLKLTDYSSGMSRVPTFHGVVYAGGGSYPAVAFTDGVRSIPIGPNMYNIQMLNGWLNGLEPYPYPDIFAKIDVAPASTTPEPSSVLLAAIALPMLGFARRKKPIAPTSKS